MQPMQVNWKDDTEPRELYDAPPTDAERREAHLLWLLECARYERDAWRAKAEAETWLTLAVGMAGVVLGVAVMWSGMKAGWL